MVEFTLDPILVGQLVLSLVLPLLVGFVTTKITSSGSKAWLLAGLALVTSLLAEGLRVVESGGVYDIGLGLLMFIPTFVISVATHYGLWKPTGTTDVVQETGNTE